MCDEPKHGCDLVFRERRSAISKIPGCHAFAMAPTNDGSHGPPNSVNGVSKPLYADGPQNSVSNDKRAVSRNIVVS